MRFKDIAAHLAGIPYTNSQKGRIFYDFILETQPVQCLELGFAHGVSSCYIAAALHELGRGHLTSVDLEISKDITPSIEHLLAWTGLGSFVTVVREHTSYNWFLKKQIETATHDGTCIPIYDFCFLDGAKNWTIDGCAFFLVDKLLKAGGWMLFDDYGWSYAEYEARTGKTAMDGVNHHKMSQDEREQPHIAAIFHHLVMPHPDYGQFRVLDNQLAYAQKIQAEVKMLHLETRASLKYKIVRAWRTITGYRG